MRILIIQEAGRHKENAIFRESLCLQRALYRLGHASVCWGPGFGSYEFDFREMLSAVDKIVILENYDEEGWLPEMRDVRKPKLFWSIDAHCAYERHLEVCQRLNVDKILCSVLPNVSDFRKDGFDTLWFPNAYPDDLIMPNGSTIKEDIGYCGSSGNPERQHYISELVDKIDMHVDLNVLGRAMVDAVCGYRIHWNRNLSTDVNYRTFETLGAGTFLLTNETPGLDTLFQIGKHLVTYTSVEDCLEKMWYYLGHEKERKAIADAGYRHAHTHHTYNARAQTLIEILQEEPNV